MAVSLMACQTFGGASDKLLFPGIDADKIAPVPPSESVDIDAAGGEAALSLVSPEVPLAESQIRASTSYPTCAQFNMNALAFAAKAEAPETLGFCAGLMRTILLATVAGAASGGVASLGIFSAFIETAVGGTVNQIAFNGARPIANAVIPTGGIELSKKAEMFKIASEHVDCPYPAWVEGLNRVMRHPF